MPSRPGDINTRAPAGPRLDIRRRLLLAALALMPPGMADAAPGSGPQAAPRVADLIHPVAVFGTDDRRPLPATHRALEASIGLLYEQRSHSVCTAFCVDDAIVATAGHCLYRTSGESAPTPAGFTFRLPGKSAKTATRIAGASAGAAPQNITSGSMRLSVQPPIDAAHDWALVRLSAPVCKGARLPVSRRDPNELVKLSAAQRIYQVAFHRDFGNWQLAFASPCAVRRTFANADWTAISHDFSDPTDVILHTCDTGGASSGSPLLIDGPSGPEVVGINVGTYVQSKVLLQNGEVIHRYQSDPVANTGVAAAAFLPRLDVFTRAEIVSSRAQVRELQELLAERGFYKGARDGSFGPVLRTAIEKFEQSEGRPETGLATTALLQRLTVMRADLGTKTVAGNAPQLETGKLGSHQPSKASASLPAR
jgi:protease YdgD